MHSVLTELELMQLKDEVVPTMVHFFDHSLNTWIKMKVDSIIELTKPSQKLFFKGINITLYPRFDHHFALALACEANPHVSLPQEYTYVKQAQMILKACMLDILDELLELLSDEGFHYLPSVPSSQRKHCAQSNWPLLPSQKPCCDSPSYYNHLLFSFFSFHLPMPSFHIMTSRLFEPC